jgi:hypothetical protein
MREARHLTTLWASTACYRDSFTLQPSNYLLCEDVKKIKTDVAMTFAGIFLLGKTMSL